MTKKIVRLTENEMTKLVKKIVNEQNTKVSCFKGSSAFEYIQGAIKNTSNWTITPSPDKNPEYIVVKYNGKEFICKRKEILNLG